MGGRFTRGMAPVGLACQRARQDRLFARLFTGATSSSLPWMAGGERARNDDGVDASVP